VVSSGEALEVANAQGDVDGEVGNGDPFRRIGGVDDAGS